MNSFNCHPPVASWASSYDRRASYFQCKDAFALFSMQIQGKPLHHILDNYADMHNILYLVKARTRFEPSSFPSHTAALF